MCARGRRREHLTDQRELDEVAGRGADDGDQQAAAEGDARRRAEPDDDAVVARVGALVFAERDVDDAAEPSKLVRHRVYTHDITPPASPVALYPQGGGVTRSTHIPNHTHCIGIITC